VRAQKCGCAAVVIKVAMGDEDELKLFGGKLGDEPLQGGLLTRLAGIHKIERIGAFDEVGIGAGVYAMHTQ
jgi:hypothetical protein